MSIKVSWDQRLEGVAIHRRIAHLAGLPPRAIIFPPPSFSSQRCCIRETRLPPLAFVLIISSSPINDWSQLQLQIQGMGWVGLFFF